MTNQVPEPLPAIKLAWLAEMGVSPDLLSHYRPRQPAAKPGTEAATESATAALKTLREAASASRSSATSPATPLMPVPASAGAPAKATTTVATKASSPMASLADSLEGLKSQALACKSCALHEQRDKLVFGGGSQEHPDWLVVGEAPGKEDDRLGLPLQGEAGALLVAMLASAGLHPESLEREDIAVPRGLQSVNMYFTNMVKCRPLVNASPQPDEVAACRGFLMQQIALIKPRRLLLLGPLPAQALLQTDAEVEALRQTVHSVATPSGQSMPALVTWHPATLLLRPQYKRQAWDDMRYLGELTMVSAV